MLDESVKAPASQPEKKQAEAGPVPPTERAKAVKVTAADTRDVKELEKKGEDRKETDTSATTTAPVATEIRLNVH
jgi:hypothetical protein